MKKYIIPAFAVVAIIAGAFLVYSNEVSAPKGMTPVTPTNSGMPVGKNAIAVDSQAPGDSVTVAMVTLEHDSWVVIHEDKNGNPGKIIAAKRVNAGTSNNVEVDLLGYKTAEAASYYAMLHSDDGDRQFDYTKDLPIKDSLGNDIAMKFRVSTSTPQEGAIDTSNWKTYSNKQYGFEFNYPDSITIQTDDFEGVTFLWDTQTLDALQSEKIPEASPIITLSIIKSPPPQFTQSWFDANGYQSVKLQDYKETLNGREVLVAKNEEWGGHKTLIVPLKGSALFIDTLDSPSATFWAVSNKILFTFKFTK